MKRRNLLKTLLAIPAAAIVAAEVRPTAAAAAVEPSPPMPDFHNFEVREAMAEEITAVLDRARRTGMLYLNSNKYQYSYYDGTKWTEEDRLNRIE